MKNQLNEKSASEEINGLWIVNGKLTENHSNMPARKGKFSLKCLDCCLKICYFKDYSHRAFDKLSDFMKMMRYSPLKGISLHFNLN